MVLSEGSLPMYRAVRIEAQPAYETGMKIVDLKLIELQPNFMTDQTIFTTRSEQGLNEWSQDYQGNHNPPERRGDDARKYFHGTPRVEGAYVM